ncbi:hypothetical protein GCM10010317_103210 [Streptomyces mirabilis]|nr:hypothetical protein GCM10010317_103210 [Streptomyces mirabilis]
MGLGEVRQGLSGRAWPPGSRNGRGARGEEASAECVSDVQMLLSATHPSGTACMGEPTGPYAELREADTRHSESYTSKRNK